MIYPRLDLTVNLTVDSRRVCNVYHYIPDPTWNPSWEGIFSLAGIMAEHWGTAYKDFLCAPNSYDGVELRYIDVSESFYGASQTDAGEGIAAAGLAEPATPDQANNAPGQDALVVSKYGEGPIRNASGTTYLCGYPEGFTDGGRVNAAGTLAVSDLTQKMKANVVADTHTFVPAILSRKKKSDPAYEGNLHRIVFTILRENVGVQKRRRPFR